MSIMASPYTIFRMPQVMRETGYARSTIWYHIKHGLLTNPIKLGGRSIGWPAAEIAAINAARIAGNDDQHIRKLVNDLHNQRRNAGQEVAHVR